MAHSGEHTEAVRLAAVVHGTVQGVGFRYLTARKARGLQLAGSAVNRADGTVDVVVEGPETAVRQLLEWLESDRAPGRVSALDATFGPATGRLHGFEAG
ncbi:acylphosphatase [Arthrobacter sp. SDTb3-6]|uniref:acylphosphatase n=1 Tax=Arthrobacter sp. SDTb3-6 TaxID=2713571 RepID=UPI00159DD0EE|nr:acylphosphatase [Arthrobacter sp. SDTb3-6]NVM98280.1 acylphosphatase [Arthrobacter sp. SDTb3-6]